MSTISAQRTPSPPRNRLLAAMSAADFALLRPHLQPINLPLRYEMERPNRPIDSVYFMEIGIASVVAAQANEIQVEVGLIGREGTSGIPVILGSDRSPHATYIQSAGNGLRISAKSLRQAMEASETLRNLLLKYAHVFMVQTAHTAIANARAKIDQRLARWILMAHDRLGDKTLSLTHEFLALMLAVRRAGVTESLQNLKRLKLIDTGRNQILVLNRKGLERMARESYGVPEKEYRRLIG
jgi:CRP-like cAMP-binding protein